MIRWMMAAVVCLTAPAAQAQTMLSGPQIIDLLGRVVDTEQVYPEALRAVAVMQRDADFYATPLPDSPITQALVRDVLAPMVFGSNRVLAERMVAQLHGIDGHDAVLAAHLGLRPFGPSCVGVARFARAVFGDVPGEEAYAQIAFVMAVTPENARDEAAVLDARDGVLTWLRAHGFMSRSAYLQGLAQPLPPFDGEC